MNGLIVAEFNFVCILSIMSNASNFIYVFGSELGAKRHRSGSASIASRFYGARDGLDEGPSGQAYAIPIFDSQGNLRQVDQIIPSVAAFLQFTRENPKLTVFIANAFDGIESERTGEVVRLFTPLPRNCLLCDEYLLLRREAQTC